VGTSSEPTYASPVDDASGEVPVPIFSQPQRERCSERKGPVGTQNSAPIAGRAGRQFARLSQTDPFSGDLPERVVWGDPAHGRPYRGRVIAAIVPFCGRIFRPVSCRRLAPA
jgi:hypothetical protein